MVMFSLVMGIDLPTLSAPSCLCTYMGEREDKNTHESQKCLHFTEQSGVWDGYSILDFPKVTVTGPLGDEQKEYTFALKGLAFSLQESMKLISEKEKLSLISS